MPVAVKSSVVTCYVDITLVVIWSLFFYVVREVSCGGGGCFSSTVNALLLFILSPAPSAVFVSKNTFVVSCGIFFLYCLRHTVPLFTTNLNIEIGSEEQDCVRIRSCRANLTTRCYVWLLYLLIFLIIFI